MQILDDVADVLTAEGVLEGRHNTAASSPNGRADLSVSGGRSPRALEYTEQHVPRYTTGDVGSDARARAD